MWSFLFWIKFSIHNLNSTRKYLIQWIVYNVMNEWMFKTEHWGLNVVLLLVGLVLLLVILLCSAVEKAKVKGDTDLLCEGNLTYCWNNANCSYCLFLPLLFSSLSFLAFCLLCLENWLLLAHQDNFQPISIQPTVQVSVGFALLDFWRTVCNSICVLWYIKSFYLCWMRLTQPDTCVLA